MQVLVVFVLSVVAALAAFPAAADPIANCRAAHGNDPDGHIACLESALRARNEPVSGAGPAAAVVEPPTGLGSEQVEQTQRASGKMVEEPAVVLIVSVTYGAQGQGVFRMEDGQVWRETEKTPPQFRLEPGRSYQARIERGTLGGYRMYVDGIRRMLKVERLQ